MEESVVITLKSQLLAEGKLKSILLNRYGDPSGPRMHLSNLDNRNESTNKVRNTIWANDEKPYLDISAKSAMSSAEAHCLYDMSKRLGSGNYANLGVAAGKSLGCLAWGLKHNSHTGKVYGIDLFNWLARDNYYQPDSINERLSSVLEYFELCKGNTHEWAERLKDLTFKGVFIDADHHYETTKLDFELWGALVGVGGEVAFHDTNKNTVDKVIQEIDLNNWQQTNHIYSLKVFRRIN